jgi:hypothetical protein
MLGGTIWPEGGRFIGDMDWRRFAWGFTALIVFTVGSAYVAPLFFGQSPMRGFVVALALVFLLAALTAPGGFPFRVVRNMWVLAYVRRDEMARWVLILLFLSMAVLAWK